jgi:hypothetical protein
MDFTLHLNYAIADASTLFSPFSTILTGQPEPEYFLDFGEEIWPTLFFTIFLA